MIVDSPQRDSVRYEPLESNLGCFFALAVNTSIADGVKKGQAC